MDLGAMINTGIAGFAGVVSLLALVISYLARRDARRSADAAVTSADAAVRSAQLAEQEAEQRMLDRYDADGPTFLIRQGQLRERGALADVTFEIEGGPDPIDVVVKSREPLCRSIYRRTAWNPTGDVARTATFLAASPGDRLEMTAGIERGVTDGAALRLRITATSREDEPRTWERLLAVPLDPEARQA